MELKELIAQFEQVEKRLLEVLAERNSMRHQLTEADQEREHLRGQVRQQAELIKKLQKKQESLQNNFQKQHNITKIVNSIGADAKDTAELKEKIEAYIHDIDKCIAYLSQS